MKRRSFKAGFGKENILWLNVIRYIKKFLKGNLLVIVVRATSSHDVARTQRRRARGRLIGANHGALLDSGRPLEPGRIWANT